VRCFRLPDHVLCWATTLPAAGGILTLALTHPQQQQQQKEEELQEGSGSQPTAASPHTSSSSGGSGSGPGQGLVAAGSMNGSVALLDSSTGTVLGSSKPHSKYVVAVAWSSCSQYLATASYDHSLTIQAVAVCGEDAAGCSNEAGSSSGAGGVSEPGDRVQLRLIRQVRMVQALVHDALTSMAVCSLLHASLPNPKCGSRSCPT
jgi:hypothetical protein